MSMRIVVFFRSYEQRNDEGFLVEPSSHWVAMGLDHFVQSTSDTQEGAVRAFASWATRTAIGLKDANIAERVAVPELDDFGEVVGERVEKRVKPASWTRTGISHEAFAEEVLSHMLSGFGATPLTELPGGADTGREKLWEGAARLELPKLGEKADPRAKAVLALIEARAMSSTLFVPLPKEE